MRRIVAFVHSAIGRHLAWLFRVTWHHPRATLAGSLLALCLAIASISGLRFESDIFKLFPTDRGALRLFLDTIEWTGSAGEAYLLLEGNRERLPAEAEALAARLRALRVDGEPALRSVSYRVVEPADLPDFAAFVGRAVTLPHLFLSPDQADEFTNRLDASRMDAALRRATAELAAGGGVGSRDLVAADPLALRELILPRLQAASQALDLDPESPYFLSRDGQLLVMIAEPARPVQDMEFARKLVAGINEARAAVGPGVSVSCAGAHLSAVIDEAVMKRNILACIASSLAVVLGLFFMTYRRVLPTLLIPVIIAFGTVMALGTAGLLLPSVHIISFAFTALIIGLGTDYSIHLYDRYRTERSAGRNTEESLRLAVVDTGHGVFTAATTTAFPFLALVISDVRALSELGLLVGLGVLYSLYATFFFLPPLLIFAERRVPDARHNPLPSLGLARLWRLTQGGSRTIAFISLAAVAGLTLAAFSISFEGDLKNLQPRHSEAFLTQERIERHLSISPRQMVVAVEGSDLSDVMRKGGEVAALAEGYRQRQEVVAITWLGSVMNGAGDQQQVLERLQKRSTVREAGRELGLALERADFDTAMFPEAVSGLGRLSSAGPVPTAEAVALLRGSPLGSMVDRFLVERNGRWHLLLTLHYRGDAFPQERFLAQLEAVAPGARATGPDLISRQLAESVRGSFLEGFAIGGILILFLLVVHFESLAGIAASLLPVVAGVISMLGLMAVTGMKINFMNAMVLVTILGMGSDYGLHVYHRLREGDGSEAGDRYVQAGRAVLLSALTTVAGFGSLAFTDYGAMSSIGWATNFGIGATAFFALVSLPAFLALRRSRNAAGLSTKE
ncbi:efflux RND transporter permease subunit [Geobacter sulfurreducens]|uniref:efflux RND transporter permease subunit n=1 Tax=Geobacter sulfurreducens TaxID=35554 RepID=UPI000DBB4E16|nr:MMPL family transporter [Geobacter sulfurreducens]BBA68997.1 Sulfolipid-1 exporter MmpL8 [Geobacter sulfurreducens]